MATNSQTDTNRASGSSLPTSKESSERYFAIVIKADDSLGSVLSASTNLGEYLKRYESDLLPPGCKITRSIEITKQKAVGTWL